MELDESTCELCGEGADDGTGEFWDETTGEAVYAHALCGTDRGLRLA